MTDLNSLKPTEEFCLKKNEDLQQLSNTLTNWIPYFGLEKYIFLPVLWRLLFFILKGYQHCW